VIEGTMDKIICTTQGRDRNATQQVKSPGAHLTARRATNGGVYAPLGELCPGCLQETLRLLHGLPAFQQNILAALSETI
jgi:hypothetical protein